MACVVGDVESEEFLFFVFLFVVEQGENKAGVLLVIVGFPFFLAAINEGLFLHLLACCHREMDALSYLLAGGVERTCEGEDGEHVVVAVVALVVMLRPLSVPIEEVLLHVALAVGVGVPHLIDGVVLALKGSFAKVEGHEFRSDVGDEGVTHREDGIAPLIAGEEQVVAQDGLPLIGGCFHRVVGGTALHPDELPVEIEVVGEAFTCTEGGVLGGALGVES